MNKKNELQTLSTVAYNPHREIALDFDEVFTRVHEAGLQKPTEIVDYIDEIIRFFATQVFSGEFEVQRANIMNRLYVLRDFVKAIKEV